MNTQESLPTVACPMCQRPNAVKRTSCLYCGADLPLTGDAHQRPSFRLLEEWEAGHNVVALPPHDDTDWPSVARWCKLSAETLARVGRPNTSLPMARLATPQDAALTVQRLAEFGARCVTVPDKDLRLRDLPPRRARGVYWDETGLMVRMTGGDLVLSMDWDDIAALVVGRLYHERTDTETQAQRKGETKILDASATSKDEPVLDVYGADLAQSWRVHVSGFDFSCLGEAKQLLAKDNFQIFINTLRTYATRTAFTDAYAIMRPLLNEVWPIVPHTSAGGVTRTFGRPKHQTTVVASNEAQFTRWSRLFSVVVSR